MHCGVFRWTLVYFGVYTDPSLGNAKEKMTGKLDGKCLK